MISSHVYLLFNSILCITHSAFNRNIVQVLIVSQDKLLWHLDQLFPDELNQDTRPNQDTWPKEPARNTMSILTRRKKTQFSCICSSVLPLQNETILLWTCPPPSVVHKPNLSKFASSIPKICDFKNWLSFFIFSSYFLFLKTIMCY